jgi:hypothetical protein
VDQITDIEHGDLPAEADGALKEAT